MVVQKNGFQFLRSCKLLMAVVVILLGDGGYVGVSVGQAYILPPAFTSMSFPMRRAPSYNGGQYSSFSSSEEEIQPQRTFRRPQRLMQRIIQQAQDEEEGNQVLKQQQQQQQLQDDGNLARKARRSNNAIYDSYRKFDPNRFAENTPEWNMAMIQYLIDMKNHGHKIKEIETSKPLPMLHKELTQGGVGRLFAPADSDLESSLKIPSSEIPEESTIVAPTEVDPVICKMEPFNVCYRLDSKGNMHPLGDRRPVRLLRVYK